MHGCYLSECYICTKSITKLTGLCEDCVDKCIDKLIEIIKDDKLTITLREIDCKIEFTIWLKPVYEGIIDIENGSSYCYKGLYHVTGWGNPYDAFKGFKYLTKAKRLGNKCAEDYIQQCKYHEYDFDELILFTAMEKYVNLEDKYKELEEKNNKLQKENANLSQENTELKYRPGGEGYMGAKIDFESYQ